MINALSVVLDNAKDDATRRVATSFERQGFVNIMQYKWRGGLLTAWCHVAQRHAENCIVPLTNGIACCVGPMWYRGDFGVLGLQRMIRDIQLREKYDEEVLDGNFAIFFHNGTQSWLLNDALGIVRIYASADNCFYSTSWLATCAYMGTPELHEEAAIEYVLLGAVHSNGTQAQGVNSLPLARIFDIETRGTRARFQKQMIGDDVQYTSFDEAADTCVHRLRKVFTVIAAQFSGRINAALSGGYDSRLIIAGLLASEVQPKLFVYGDKNAKDVAIARDVAQALNMPISVIDKALLNRGLPSINLDCLVHNALFFDGLPNDGIYDAGADRQTRLAQNADGWIALNGGGGEIFRNFFHLPDRDLHLYDVVRAFYRGFDKQVFRKPAMFASFEERLVESMSDTLVDSGVNWSTTLDRHQVELIYPLFRCHYWMSVNNSVAMRHGYYVTPLVDLQSVRLAYRLPLTWKNAGKFESCLITKLNHAAAKQISTYGFRFSDGPNRLARFTEWLTCIRPISVRPQINALRRRLHGVQVESEMLHDLRRILPGEWRIDSLLDLRQLPDNGALARASAIELVWRHILA